MTKEEGAALGTLRLEKCTLKARQMDIVFVSAILLLANSILRGIRTPDLWAYTQLLFNYDFGFTRRALLGTLISASHIPYLYSYEFCFSLDVIIFASNIALLIELLRRMCATLDVSSRVSVLVFSSSFGVVLLSGTIGYFEHIGLLVTLLALRTKDFYRRATLVLVLFPIVLLIYETNFLLFFPVICFRFIADLAQRSDRRRWIALSSLTIGLSTFTLVLGKAHLTDAGALSMYHSLQAKADYPLHKLAFATIHIPTSFESSAALRHLLRFSLFQHLLLSIAIVTLPTTLYLLSRSIRKLSGDSTPIGIRLAAVAASLAPLSVNLLAGDFVRWNTLAITASFLAFTIAALNFRSLKESSSRSLASAGLAPGVLIAINLGSAIPLSYGQAVQSFPYEEHVDYVRRLASRRERFPPAPAECAATGDCVMIIHYLCPIPGVDLNAFKSNTNIDVDCTDGKFDDRLLPLRIRHFMAQP